MNLSEQELAEFREIFNLVDLDHGGSISSDELGRLMEILGIKASPEELADMIAEIDIDGNGDIDFNEFLLVMTKKVQGDYSMDQVKAAFKSIAGGQQTTLAIKDLEHALVNNGTEKLTLAEARELLDQLDNKDGRFDYIEFVNMMMK
jgi:calmodulin